MVHSSAMHYQNLIIIHECSKKLLKMKHSNNKKLTPSTYAVHTKCGILYRYWPGRSWNITFRWIAKRVIFSQGIIFSRRCAALRENIVPRENITILAPPTRGISSVPVDICYIRWSKLMISSNCMCSTTITKFGNKTRSLRTKQNWTQTWQLAHVLLWRSIVNHYVLCVRGAFLSGSVS